MLTVQLSIQDHQYATALAKLLEADGTHEVAFVDRPDPGIDGIIVVDGNRTESLLLFESQPERFVVITRKDAGLLSKVWEAGVHHVVFEEDAPSTALLAVIAAELRTPRKSARGLPMVQDKPARQRLLPSFPMPACDMHTDGCRSCFSKIRKTHFEVHHYDD